MEQYSDHILPEDDLLMQHRRRLKKALKKFKRDDYLELWEYHKDFCIALPHFDKDRPLKTIVNELLDVAFDVSLKKSSIEDLIGHFSLLYVAYHSDSKYWKTYLMKNIGDSEEDTVTRNNLESEIQRIFEQDNLYCHTTSLLRNEGIWLRVVLSGDRFSSSGSFLEAYIFCVPCVPGIYITNNARKQHEKKILQAISTCYGKCDFQHLPLLGHNISGLFMLAIQKESQRVFNTSPEGLPLLVRRTRKRLAALPEAIPEIEDKNQTSKQEKRKYIESIFGEYDPPQIEKLQLNAGTRFLGEMDHPDTIENVQCTITFQGANIIKGLAYFVEEGITRSRRLPKYIEQLPILGTNTVYIED